MAKLGNAIPRNTSFTSKKNIQSYIFISISDRQVLFNHSFDLSSYKLLSFLVGHPNLAMLICSY